MDCRNAAALVPLYVDDELDRATARELEAHAEGCPDCLERLQALSELSTGLRRTAQRHAAPIALRERIRREAAPARPAGRRAAHWLAVAASWLIAFTAGTLWTRSPIAGDGHAAIASDLLSSHLRALAAASPVDVASSDHHTVKPWFAGRIALAPPAGDFTEQGFALAGGRIDYVGAARVAVLVYRHGPHLVDVYVLPGTPPGSLDSGPIGAGYHATRTTLAGQAAIIVSDMDPREAGQLATLLAAER